jgi:hypothetical protein
MPKRRTLVCLALAIVAIGVGIYLCLPRSPRFTVEQFDRIQIGMTQAEVEAVLGCSPGNYTQSKLNESVLLLAEADENYHDAREFSQHWVGDTPEPCYFARDGSARKWAIGARVRFDAAGRVIGIDSFSASYSSPTLLAQLRAWVGW